MISISPFVGHCVPCGDRESTRYCEIRCVDVTNRCPKRRPHLKGKFQNPVRRCHDSEENLRSSHRGDASDRRPKDYQYHICRPNRSALTHLNISKWRTDVSLLVIRTYWDVERQYRHKMKAFAALTEFRLSFHTTLLVLSTLMMAWPLLSI